MGRIGSLTTKSGVEGLWSREMLINGPTVNLTKSQYFNKLLLLDLN
jgi:hypothetical protein